jgi:hypothetical protein
MPRSSRGKAPSRVRRPRADDLRQRLHNLRRAHELVLIAEGHLIAHRRAETDAAHAAKNAGATTRELVEATGGRWHAGKRPAALRRVGA